MEMVTRICLSIALLCLVPNFAMHASGDPAAITIVRVLFTGSLGYSLWRAWNI